MSLAALVFMFQAVTAAPPPPPEPSIDYVLVREVNHFDYPRRVERHTITRRGVRMRDEYVLDGIASVTYSNTSTGVSIAISRDAGGRPRSLQVSQTLRRDEPRDAPRPERTRQHDTVAGERCAVWRFPGAYGSRTEACITPDGVRMWSRTIFRSGETMNDFRVVRLERRRVSEAEMSPPPELLRWSTWTRLYPATLQLGLNDEVVLRGDGRGGDETRVLRRLGAARSEDSRSAAGRNLTIYTGALVVQYLISEHERTFSIVPTPPGEDRAVVQNERGNVLGHACRWYDSWPGVSDAGRWDCRTADGASLAIRQSSWGRMWRLTATQYRRGVVTPESFAPPPEAFRWTY